ncbi:MAG TPA: HD domain-containing protein [Gammaproteobacteria bacterium]|nr:HD domain-containing protein [Gammaproteobacteria bacterium]
MSRCNDMRKKGMPTNGAMTGIKVDTADATTDVGAAQVQPIRWISSLRTQISLALALLAAAFTSTVVFTLYEVGLRKHDYAILNLAGQLRVTSQSMAGQALHYRQATGSLAENAVANGGPSTFARDLNHQVQLFDRIIKAFEERSLPPELTGRAEVLDCNWDEEAVAQLETTARFWRTYRQKLLRVWGKSRSKMGETLQLTAQYVLDHDEALQGAATDLTHAFQHMMENKLRLLKQVNQAALLFMVMLLAFILALLYRKVLHPLKLTLAGFNRVWRGELGYQVPVTTDNEIGQMTQGFNHLSRRLDTLFRLTDRINHGTSLSDTLCFIFEEFRGFLPLDWVGMLSVLPDKRSVSLERMHTVAVAHPQAGLLREGKMFADPAADFDVLLRAARPLPIPHLDEYAQQHPEAEFAMQLQQEGFGAAVYLPLSSTPDGGMMLVFATRQPCAYTEEHLEWLTNIAGQVAHSVERTVVMEDLVISAVSGLAKLAESRDPETGDHLVRMSLYSVIIAEQLAGDSEYGAQLNSNTIRDIFRFAPMHDIGKVGIKDEILLKPGRLTAGERAEMEKHPGIGGQVLRRSEAQMNAHGHSIFTVGIEIAECHHEKFDGSGYPNGLAGQDIPLSARIVAVADVFDALTSKRPYKEAWSIEKAMAVLREDAGGHFDPLVIAAAERSLPRMLDVYERLKHV